MIKVLHVLASNKFSGAENVVCQIINLFSQDENFDMTYCSPNGDISKTLQEKNIKFIPLQKLKPKELKKIVNEYKPDIIHAHDMKATFISALLKSNIPIISHIHNSAFNSRKFSIKSLLYLYSTKKVNHIFWVSEGAKNSYYYKDKVAHKSSVLSNVINYASICDKLLLDTNEYDYDIVFLGRLTGVKNPNKFLDVVSLVAKEKPNLKVAIIGCGELEQELKTKVSVLRLDKNVDFFGFLSMPYKILKCTKVMLMTSLWEGLPMCVLEAMSLGVPVVSTLVEGVKEVIIDDENGYLRDSVDDLAEKIIQILNDSSLRKRLSKKAIELFEKINDVNEYKKRLTNIYTQSISSI